MDNTPCLITTAENAAAARIERSQSLYESAMNLLANELGNALKAQNLSHAKVSTPAYADDKGGTAQMTVLELMSDMFAGKEGDAILTSMLQILVAAAQGEQVAHRAITWRAQLLGYHAATHADALAADWVDGLELGEAA